MTNKKELNEQELNEITGGHQENTSYIKGKVGAHIGQHDAPNYIGRRVYVIDDDDPIDYAAGTLVNSYMDTSGCSDERKHVIDIDHINFWGSLFDDTDNCVHTLGMHTFSGDDVTLYLAED